MLQRNLKKVGQLKPLIVRNKNGKYGIVGGRRTFLANRDNVKEFPCIVKELDDYTAIIVSLADNLFVKPLNPVYRARAFKRLLEHNHENASAIARKMGIPKSTLSEYLSILDLSPQLQSLLEKGIISFRNAVKIQRLRLTFEEQAELARIALKKGKTAFKAALAKVKAEKETRGAPRGLFVVRFTLGDDSAQALKRIASENSLKTSDYVKNIVEQHLASI